MLVDTGRLFLCGMGKERRERRAITNGGNDAPGVDNTHRKTWNKDEYEDKAAQREIKVKSCKSLCTSCSSRGHIGNLVAASLQHLVFCQEKQAEESALDAKKRRRLGDTKILESLSLGKIQSASKKVTSDFQTALF